MKVSIIDTETTGLSPDDSKLLEVAIVDYDLAIGDVIEARSFLVLGAGNEEIEKTQSIHGISPKLVHEYGMYNAEVQIKISQIIRSSSALLAHNADFDSQWINENPDGPPWVCTQNDIPWPKGLVSPSLASLALSHGVGIVSAHRAMDDCLTIARVLKRVAEKHDIVALVRHGMRPKAMYKAVVPYEERDLAKQAGFKWNPERKIWWRKMAMDDVGELGFQVVRIVS